MFSTFRVCLLALITLVSCTDFGGEECKGICTSLKFEVGFFNRATEAIDSLAQDSVRMVVLEMTSTSLSADATADCEACQSRFTQSQLFSDRSLRTSSGKILAPATNLLDTAVVGSVGTEGIYSLNFFQATTLEKGTHTFSFKARLDGTEITAKGALWVPDSLGF